MATLAQMLSLNGGSYRRAEQMALDKITQGDSAVWLDLALLLSTQGKFEGARQALASYKEYLPDCDRLKFCLGWQHIHNGDLQVGLSLLERGRVLSSWGSPFPRQDKPAWHPSHGSLKDKTVLLAGEGGIGDNLINIRCVFTLKDMGAFPVVSCPDTAVNMLRLLLPPDIPVVSEKGAPHIHCDSFIPCMRAPLVCGYTFRNLPSAPYLKLRERLSSWDFLDKEEARTGIVWKGNPDFEHEQLRRFPEDLLFDALGDIPCLSLQKDSDIDRLPDNVKDISPMLHTWEDTVQVIDRLDTVVSSCTAVAHLAAAMGKRTFVIVPILPYYIWAYPGDKSPWYDTVTLCRQTRFGSWHEPFEKLRKEIRNES